MITAQETADDLLPEPRDHDPVSHWRVGMPLRHAWLAAMAELEPIEPPHGWTRERFLANQAIKLAAVLLAHAVKLESTVIGPVGAVVALLGGLAPMVRKCPGSLARMLLETLPAFIDHHREQFHDKREVH